MHGHHQPTQIRQQEDGREQAGRQEGVHEQHHEQDHRNRRQSDCHQVLRCAQGAGKARIDREHVDQEHVDQARVDNRIHQAIQQDGIQQDGIEDSVVEDGIDEDSRFQAPACEGDLDAECTNATLGRQERHEPRHRQPGTGQVDGRVGRPQFDQCIDRSQIGGFRGDIEGRKGRKERNQPRRREDACD